MAVGQKHLPNCLRMRICATPRRTGCESWPYHGEESHAPGSTIPPILAMYWLGEKAFYAFDKI
jgi:hypothetical protein